jgi:hypothetical protein
MPKTPEELAQIDKDQLISYQRAQRFRFQEQCFLNYWKAYIYQELSKRRPYRRPLESIDNGNAKGGLRARPTSKNLDVANVYTYDYISTLHTLKPAELVSSFNRKAGADTFFRLDSSVMTQLKPIVELYKIYPSETGVKKGASKKDPLQQYRVPMPIGENIKIDEEGRAFGGDLSSLEDLYWDHDVLGNAMLTDLKFKFAGQNVALLNTVEDVSFTLSFSSFNMFTHEFKTTIDQDGDEIEKSWSYQDLISYSTKYLNPTPGAGVAIDDARSVSCYETAEQFVGPSAADTVLNENSKYWEIQMVVRYDPDDIDWNMVERAGTQTDGALELWGEHREALKSFLRNSAINLRLQFVGHTIRYSSNSSGANPELVIDFEYKAYVENSMNSQDLDLLTIPGPQSEQIFQWEERLKNARRALIGVQNDKKTLGAIFGARGETKTNLSETYTSLRKKVDAGTEMNDLQWLVFSPVPGSIPGTSGKSAADKYGLIPTPTKLKNLRGSKTTGRKGLYNAKSPGAALENTASAVKVFEELVDKILHYIKTLRRASIQEKYRSFINVLYMQERVYAAKLKVESFEGHTGFKAAGASKKASNPEKKSATDMAKARLNVAQVAPDAISIVPNVSEWVHEFANADDIKELSTALGAVNVEIMNKTYSEQAKTQTKEIQGALSNERGLGVPTVNGSDTYIYFTNLGDIIDVAIAIATYPSHGLYERRLGLLLGPTLEEDKSATIPGADSKYLLNLAYTPVSLKAFIAFFINKVVASGKERYLLNDFIKDLIGDLILPALGSKCIESSQEGNQEVGTITFTSEMRYGAPKTMNGMPPFYPMKGGLNHPPKGASAYAISPNLRQAARANPNYHPVNDDIGWYPVPWGNNGDISDLTEVSPNTPLENQFNYMFIYINNISPTRLDPAKETANANNGIYYLHLGQIPSIVKSASFRKENMPYLREARAMSQLTRTGGISLRDVYHFGCTMYGNNIFKPGMLFFVDPTRDGSGDYDKWKTLGLVGFYRVYEVDHQINTGQTPIHETSLSAKWVTFGSCDKTNGLIDTGMKDIFFINRGDVQWTKGS